MLKLNYKYPQDYIATDIEKLRPKGSYKTLISRRNYPIETLIQTHGHIPDSFLKQRPCPTCGSTSYQPELEKDHLWLVKCDDCSLIYVNPVFDEDHYQEIYKSTEYQAIVRELGEESHNYRVERFGKERVDIMRQYYQGEQPPKYLDVGCSTGFVVEAAQLAGWDACGIDLNPSAIAFGQKRGLNLRNVDLVAGNFVPESFDIISLFDVLEHLINPKEILAQALKLLKKGGLIFLYVPNYDSASRLLMGKEAHFIWPTHHLNYYTPQTITDLLKRLSLQVAFMATEGLDMADYIWWQQANNKNTEGLQEIADTLQFFINAGAYGKNLRILARKL